MTTLVDEYFTDGCGRCPFGGTPACKVHTWSQELVMLRKIILSCGLIEESKWGMPTYTFQQNNVLILAAFKEYCSVSFFKGALLTDENGLLSKAGEYSQAARQFKFRNIQDITPIEATIKAYIYEAIELEKAGLKVEFKKNPEPIPEEFQNKLDEFPNLKVAFEALTPSRQRGYILHFSQPKQSQTRTARVEKYIEQILNGKSLSEG